MHDGAGAWLKSSVARAVLAGVGIDSVEAFFQYCRQFLSSNMSSRNFTAQRYFYLITLEAIATHRATMASMVTGSIRMRPTKKDATGWFCWTTTDTYGVINQRRAPCDCDACGIDDFAFCENVAEDSSNGVWWNAPHTQV